MADSQALLGAIGKAIRAQREKIGISQIELAERAGLHRTFINNIERGAKNLSLESLVSIADALELTASGLVIEAEELAKNTSSAIKVLLIEDNPADIFMFKRCVNLTAHTATVQVLQTGQEVQYRLEELRKGVGDPPPDIIFLDLNLPGRSGHEILTDIKSNEALRHIPIIILTTSSRPDDIKKTYFHFANSFLTKPLDPTSYEKAIDGVLTYWFSTTKMPSMN